LIRRLALTTGLTYNVLEWGTEHAQTIVLVHGFLDLAWGWDEVPAILAQRYHVIAPDLRGHGDSDWVGRGGYYHFFDYLPDLDEVVARLARGPVVMVGHSMGGSVAAYWAGTRPENVRALVLLEGIGPPEATTSVPERTARWIGAWSEARGKARVMPSLADAAARLRKHDPLLDEARARVLAAKGTRAVDGGVVWKHDPLHLTQGPYPYRVDTATQFWNRVNAPVLYVEGAQSRFRLADADTERRLAAFPNCKRTVIPNVGHMMMRHDPAAVAAAIESVLR
jgi:pimeloyl-ACP methyl ester carboxylesterase